MKSTLNIESQPHIEHTFPALYKSTTSDLVVLAYSIETGTVVVRDNSGRIGDYCDMWTAFDDPSEWQRLPPGSSVTLTQE